GRIDGRIEHFPAPPSSSPEPAFEMVFPKSPDVFDAIPSDLPVGPVTPRPAAVQPSHPHHDPGWGEWVGSQLFFVACGFIFALLALIIAPSASVVAVRAIDSEPLRCLIVGVVGAALLGIANAVNVALVHTIIWIPAFLIIAGVSAALSIYASVLGV